MRFLAILKIVPDFWRALHLLSVQLIEISYQFYKVTHLVSIRMSLFSSLSRHLQMSSCVIGMATLLDTHRSDRQSRNLKTYNSFFFKNIQELSPANCEPPNLKPCPHSESSQPNYLSYTVQQNKPTLETCNTHQESQAD